MAVNHQIMRLVVALGIGLLLSFASYQWLTDTERPERRAEEVAVVNASRSILLSYIDSDDLAVSDALDRVREAGKVYVFPTEQGWELSGHYQRVGERIWHDFLMHLDKDLRLERLVVNDDDTRLQALAESDPLFSTGN